MYTDEIDLGIYYTKMEIQKLIGKTPQQLWRLETYFDFPKSILVKTRSLKQWVRPSKAYFLKDEVHRWIDEHYDIVEIKNKG